MWRILPVALILSVLAVSDAPAQFGFNVRAPLSDMTPDDMALLRQSVRAVLDDGAVGARDAWNNADTGMSGENTLLEAYTVNDAACARVLAIVRTNREQFPFDLTLCQQDNGTWAIAG